MDNVVTTEEHYDMLIDEGSDPFRDGDILKEYMKRWDGTLFYDCLNLSDEKVVLEVGIGTGRVAQNVLNIGCKSLTGLDISPKTIERAKENLSGKYNNIELLLQNIEDFRRESYYDVIYSVLTFMHIKDKERALSNIVHSLKPNGNVVLSISEQSEWLDYGRKIRLFPKKPEYYIEILKKLNCDIIKTIDLIDTYIYPPTGEKQPEYGQRIATIINARKK